MITFKIFAGTDVGLRDNNEDNFTICSNLETNQWIVPSDHQKIFELSEKGSLLVVADGMGGQNAGEVASAIAIETVQHLFSNEITKDLFSKPEKIKNFLKRVIVEADVRIKSTAKENPSTSGMGSTLVIAWVINQTVYVSWIGDSRAYSFVPDKGIARLSKDHSYVQKLVDAHKLTDDEAMVHPDSNIITRSLGDVSQTAHPDVAAFSLEKGEIILLCSDGLCGVCKDELIGGILQEEYADLKVAKEKLIDAALANGGSDNITVALLQVVDIDKNFLKNQGRKILTEHGLIETISYKKWLLSLSVLLNIILIILCVLKEPLAYSTYDKLLVDSLSKVVMQKDSIISKYKENSDLSVKETLDNKNIKKTTIKDIDSINMDVISKNKDTENIEDSITDDTLTETFGSGQESIIPQRCK